MASMKLISFNLNGVKSMTGKLKNGEKKGSATNNVIKSLIEEQQPDVLCFQELKSQSAGDIAWLRVHFPHLYTNFSKHKKGYSGVALMSKVEPEWITDSFEEFGEEWIGEYVGREFHDEGRIITAKFPDYIVITVYTPNAQPKLARLEERIAWEQVLRMYVMEMEKKHETPVILCGDLNCAHQEIDLHNPKANRNSPGFSKEERQEFQLMLDAGFTDSFRHLHPERVKYSYFSNFARSRERNVGWRIDYFLVSNAARDRIQEADILNDYFGSDHCPVLLVIQ
jgi:exodeoxyribonuclease-3